MTKDEILQSCHTLKECYVKEYINPSCFGHLTINFNGEVCCLNERIESLRDMDLPYIINKWVGSQGCLWYLARNKDVVARNVLFKFCAHRFQYMNC